MEGVDDHSPAPSGCDSDFETRIELVDAVGRDVFVSYTSADRAWAEWIGWQLKQAGLSVVLQAWDMLPGGDFVHEMQRATTTAGRTIAVLSPAYLSSQFGEAEWRVAFANDPSGEKRLLIPVRVAEVSPPGLLATKIYIDLVGKDRDRARRALLDGLQDQPAVVPTTEPAFPGGQTAAVEVFGPIGQEPRFPSALPPVWNVPYLRNWAFTGRQALLAGLADNLGAGTTTAITQAIAGLGGVGKTSLAVEYAYRQHTRFEVVWWVRAEEPAALLADYAALAGQLRLPEAQAGQSDPVVLVGAVRRWLAGHDHWLLVFDNAVRPEEVTELLPAGGGGQVLITSRWVAWGEWAHPAAVERAFPCGVGRVPAQPHRQSGRAVRCGVGRAAGGFAVGVGQGGRLHRPDLGGSGRVRAAGS